MNQATKNRMIDIECIVNLHKTAYGVRPRGDDFSKLLSISDDEIDRYIAHLSAEAERRLDEDRRQAATMKVALEKHLEGLMMDYNISRETAIRWEMDAHDCQDREHWLYLWGIDFDDMHNFM